MKILRYRYNRPDIEEGSINGERFGWIDVNDTNLFVGRNASGKSTVSVVATIFRGLFLPSNASFLAEIEVDLINAKNEVVGYYIKWNQRKIQAETLTINGRLLVDRSESSAKIFSEVKKEYIDITPPSTTTTIQVRRDEKEHPFFEELAEWAKGIFLISFADSHPTHLDFGGHPGWLNSELHTAFDDMTEDEKSYVIAEINSLGYNLRELNILKEGHTRSLNVQEATRRYGTPQAWLSQGMFRSLLILVYLNFLIYKRQATLIVIDDLCEGLDFDRAATLGKMIFDKMKEKNIQLIATSNDFFLMNSVSIEDWTIIKRRSNGLIKNYNYKNSKQLFDDFKFTGLNNFQLFASDYLDDF